MTIKPTRFTLRIPDADIADLRDRLARSRFPDQIPGGAWDYGTDVTYLLFGSSRNTGATFLTGGPRKPR